MQNISATELTRNTLEILDRVVTRGEIVTIERNHILIAQIMTASQALTGMVLPILTPQQASAWLQDSKDSFGDMVPDPWA
jgi:antitoxin (DNA-binding transcriptional repressor) of toxin-antitoxin stability system